MISFRPQGMLRDLLLKFYSAGFDHLFFADGRGLDPVLRRGLNLRAARFWGRLADLDRDTVVVLSEWMSALKLKIISH